MKEVIDTYSDDELDDLGTANENLDFTSEDYVAAGTPEYQEYVERLNECVTGDGEAATQSTDESGSTDAPETTAG